MKTERSGERLGCVGKIDGRVRGGGDVGGVGVVEGIGGGVDWTVAAA